MALTKEERTELKETHDNAIQIRTVLLGTNGDEGLCGEVRRLANSHYKLRKHFWILAAFLAGSGILTGGIWAILNL